MTWLGRFSIALSLSVFLLLPFLATPADAWPLRPNPRVRHCTPLTYGFPNSCHASPVEWRLGQ